MSSRPPGKKGMVGPRHNAIASQKQITAEELSATYDRCAFFIFNAVFVTFCTVYVSVCLFFG